MTGLSTLLSPNSLGVDGISRRSVITNGLVFYAPLGHPALRGNSFRSLDRLKHLCTVTGALWTPQGRSFDGDDKIVVPNHTLLKITSAITLEVWAKQNVTGGSKILIAKDTHFQSNANNYYGLAILANSPYFGVGDGTTSNQISGSAIANTNWHHIVGTWDTTNCSIYIDLVKTTQASTIAAIQTSDDDVWLGQNNWVGLEYPLNGIIGEIRIYYRALTASEILQNYLATKWRFSG